MSQSHKKYLIVLLTSIGSLCFSTTLYAVSPLALGKLGKASNLTIKTAKVVREIKSIKSVSSAFKPVKVNSFKPNPLKTQIRTKVFSPVYTSPTLIPKNAGQFKMNQQRLAIQTDVKKSVDLAKKNLGIKSPARLHGKFDTNANPGIIYRRQMKKDVYIGQTKNLKRYPKRQYEHNRKLQKTMEARYGNPSYQIVAGAPGNNARLLRVAEEAANRSQKQFGVTLTNKISPMANRKYLSAIRQ